MRNLGTCLLVLIGLCLGAARAQTPNDYAARWPLQAPGVGPVWHVEAGEQVLAALQDPGLGDVQVFNASGEAVPTAYLGPSPAATTASRWWPARFASSGPAEGAAGDAGVMSYGYRLPASLAVDGVRIALGARAAPTHIALQYRSGETWITAVRLTAAGDAAADTVAFPQGVTAHEWRLRSGRMLAPAPTLQFAARPPRFAFRGDGASPFTLAVGSPVLRRRDPAGAELAQLHATSGRDGPPRLATPGARSNAPFPAAAAAKPIDGAWRPSLAGGLLLGLAGIGAWFALRRRHRRHRPAAMPLA